LHARASAKLVHLSSRYGSHIEIIKNEQVVNGKSIMGVMMLAASKGTEIELSVTGEDELDAMAALEALIENRFGEAE
ncbi:MAG: phosphotransferase system, HPR-related protein, partial [Gammaproteobacteria bacterium]|nr:phosphotransferase system, HPR-related protein [Gammaproteobacteria bacterium]